MRRSLGWALASAMCWFAPPVLAEEVRLRVLADPWCPYNCEPGSPRPGYVIELLQAALPPGNALDYRVVPWERALAETADGRADVALVVTSSGVERFGLVVGREPAGMAADCLFVATTSSVRSLRRQDLDRLKSVGIVAGYEYDGPIGAWLQNPAYKDRIRVTGGVRPAEVNAHNLALGRLDAVVEDAQVMQHVLLQLGLGAKVRQAGCQAAGPVYVGFSPRHPQARQLAERLDHAVQEQRRSGQLARLLTRYGLSDWK